MAYTRRQRRSFPISLSSLDDGLEFLWAGLEDFDFLLESLGIGAWELGGPPEETEPAARAFME